MAKFSVTEEITTTLKTWTNLLRNLSFEDNFKVFEWEGEIEAGQTMKIFHDLKVTPTQFLITHSRGTQNVTEGDTPHTDQFFYVKNRASTSTFIGTILILP